MVPSVGHGGVYNPQFDTPGNYVYTVPGNNPCPNATATVVVTEPQAPNAGTNASVALCSNSGTVLMRTLLGGQPAASGSWIYVTGGNVPHGENFDPASDLPGEYLYTVAGDAPCPNASATLVLTVNPATNAGTSDTLQACLSQTDIDLFAALGAGAQAGGIWEDVNGSGAFDGNSFNPSQAGNGSWPFTYAVAGISPCTTSVATITIDVGVGGAAGGDSIVVVCGNLTAYDLFTALSGSPQTGGSWTDGFGTGALGPDGVLNPSLLPFGGQFPFTYTINDPDCGLVTAVVRVTAAPYPVAGTGASLTLCSTSSSIDLFDQLSGDPDVDGSWTNPSGQAHGDFFIPGTDAPGNYTYTVAGTAPCSDASAVVAISVNDPPDAGSDGALLACDTVQSLVLFAGLQGSPQAGGTWQDMNGSGGLTGGSLNTTSINPGTYAYSYTVAVPGCAPDMAQVSVNVVGGVEVSAVQRDCIARDRTYVVTFIITDGDAATYEVTGLTGSISATAPFTFTSEPLLTSQDFEAIVRDQYGCSEVRITGATPCDFANDVFVPESFSPNGDGTNDRFVIPGIEGFPSNSIIIFNRWGAKLYEASAYDNKAVVWDGSTAQGEAPAGTYFYVLDLGNGKDALTGFIYLNR